MKKIKFFALAISLIIISNALLSCQKPNVENAEGISEKQEEAQVLLEPRTEYSDFINYRQPLYNTYKKLNSEKQLKVIYFGGSVTVGYGCSDNTKYSWRALISKWLEESFPEAKVDNISRGLGESGTYLGTFRLKMDVIEQKPDLVFIEYSINDRYYGSSYANAKRQFETIIREIKTALPETDIVTVLVTDSGCLEANSRGELHAQAKAHEDISVAYNIPSLHVGRVLAKTCNYSQSEFSPKYAIDIVHLTDEGNRVYYDCIEEFMYNSLFCTSYQDYTPTYELAPIVSDSLFDGNRQHILPTQQLLERSEELGGVSVDFSPLHYAASSSYAKGVYTLNSKDDILAIEFDGTELALWSNYYKEDILYISLDDGDYIKKNATSHAPLIVASGLEPGKHVARIKIAVDDKPMKIGSIFTRDETKATKKS